MKRILLFLVGVSLTLPVHPAGANDRGSGTLDPENQRVEWTGSRFTNAGTLGPEFCELPNSCDRFTLRVRLGKSFWTFPGAVQIGIEWTDPTKTESESEYDTFELYVYDAESSLITSSVNALHSSTGIASTAQVLDLPAAAVPDGDYTVVVVAGNVADNTYRGLAMIQSYEPPVPEGDLLPDLTALQPTNFKIRIGTYSLSRNTTDIRSCYVEETFQDETHPQRCLRFDAAHANLGDGDFLLDIDLAGARPQVCYEGCIEIAGPVAQVIRQADGSERSIPAGDFRFHPNHGHIHYSNFARYELYGVNGDGTRGALVAPSQKADFCMIDVADLWFGMPGNRPRDHHFPQCNTFDGDRLAERPFPPQLVQRQGINRGWADVYTWDLPGQYIDVTGVPDGVYDVVNRANPNGILAELTPSNNEAAVRIRLLGDAVTCIPEPYGCPVGTTPHA